MDALTRAFQQRYLRVTACAGRTRQGAPGIVTAQPLDTPIVRVVAVRALPGVMLSGPVGQVARDAIRETGVVEVGI